MNSQKTFIFKSHKADLARGEVFFNYTLRLEDKNIDFTEKISFPPVKDLRIPQVLVNNILDGLLLILGISYWKLYCPRNIVLESVSLTREQADFWNTVYAKGMGELYYKNKINFHGLVKFPCVKKAVSPTDFPRQNRSLVAIGGGKDSIVSAELLKKYNKQFGLLVRFPIQIEVAKIIGGEIIQRGREIDPKLLELSKQKGVFNGHIPISVFYAFVSLLMAALFDYRYVIVSNERSANYGNVKYLGEVINHQWSKSFEFEKLFQDYVTRYISPDIHYFSLIRPLSEIKVVELFAKYKKYLSVFSSCNTNFEILKQAQDDKRRWCGKCAKCAFVFTLLSAFVSKEELSGIFGKNLYQDKKLVSVFEELLGIKNFKPLECVGTPEEMKLALYLAYKKNMFDNNVVMKMFIEKVLPKMEDVGDLEKELLGVSLEDSIPEEFRPIIKSL